MNKQAIFNKMIKEDPQRILIALDNTLPVQVDRKTLYLALQANVIATIPNERWNQMWGQVRNELTEHLIIAKDYFNYSNTNTIADILSSDEIFTNVIIDK